VRAQHREQWLQAQNINLGSIQLFLWKYWHFENTLILAQKIMMLMLEKCHFSAKK
jgi:hypothetical protein